MIKLTFSNIYKPIYLLLIVLGFCLNVDAQEADNVSKIQNSKVNFLSKKFKLTLVEAKQMVLFMDSTTRLLNKIYHDSTITDDEKIRRLNALEKVRKTKIKAITPVNPVATESQRRRGEN